MLLSKPQIEIKKPPRSIRIKNAIGDVECYEHHSIGQHELFRIVWEKILEAAQLKEEKTKSWRRISRRRSGLQKEGGGMDGDEAYL